MKQHFLTRVARRLGFELVPTWRFDRVHQSDYLEKLLRFQDIDCVFDVGANRGQYRDYLRQQLGYQGLIVSVEPHPVCAAALAQRAAADPLWEIVPLALGAQAGQLEFKLMADTQFSSFLTPLASELYTGGGGNVVDGQATVDVTTLDQLYPALQQRLGFRRPMLKIDTQGFEIPVLQGGAGVIGAFGCLQVELSNIPIYAEIADMNETIAVIRELGFHLSTMFPTNPDQFPVAIDFDAYFIRK